VETLELLEDLVLLVLLGSKASVASPAFREPLVPVDQPVSLDRLVLLARMDSPGSRVDQVPSEHPALLDFLDSLDSLGSLETKDAEVQMASLEHLESVVTRVLLVREAAMVVVGRTDLLDFLDVRELLVTLGHLDLLVQMVLTDSQVSDGLSDSLTSTLNLFSFFSFTCKLFIRCIK